jgi:hypothetical protein
MVINCAVFFAEPARTESGASVEASRRRGGDPWRSGTRSTAEYTRARQRYAGRGDPPILEGAAGQTRSLGPFLL